jgi:peptide/nickel transport system substrate-binding protein
LTLPNTSAIRQQMALQIQEQLRQVGVRLELEQMEGPIWNERRNAGRFDIDFSAVTQDPSPSGLAQAWSCGGRTNVAHYCDPAVDSLLDAAGLATENAGPAWHAVLQRIEGDAPAIFMYAPSYLYAVHRRFTNVRIRPESSWLALREWSVAPAAAERAAGY